MAVPSTWKRWHLNDSYWLWRREVDWSGWRSGPLHSYCNGRLMKASSGTCRLAMNCATANSTCCLTHRLQLTGGCWCPLPVARRPSPVMCLYCGGNQQLNDGRLPVSCRRTSVATRIDRPPSVKVRAVHKPAGTPGLNLFLYTLCLPSQASRPN